MIRPGRELNQFGLTVSPVSWRISMVPTPLMPMVAMKAKASITPPNCASTDEMALTMRRSSPFGLLPITSAYEATAPTTAPMSAEITETRMEAANAAMVFASKSLLKLLRVNPPSTFWNAPTITITVGASRKQAV